MRKKIETKYSLAPPPSAMRLSDCTLITCFCHKRVQLPVARMIDGFTSRWRGVDFPSTSAECQRKATAVQRDKLAQRRWGVSRSQSGGVCRIKEGKISPSLVVGVAWDSVATSHEREAVAIFNLVFLPDRIVFVNTSSCIFIYTSVMLNHSRLYHLPKNSSERQHGFNAGFVNLSILPVCHSFIMHRPHGGLSPRTGFLLHSGNLVLLPTPAVGRAAGGRPVKPTWRGKVQFSIWCFFSFLPLVSSSLTSA